jgi:hypothetical protein
MNEITFWSNYVKPALNSKHFDRVAWKVGTSTRAGIPDVAYRSKNLMAWIELKYVDHWPVRDTTPLTLGLSLEQQAHLREWCADGHGHGFVIVLVAQDVIVFPWYVHDVIERTNISSLAMAQMQLKEVKNLLARELDSLIFPGPGMTKIRDAAWAILGEG